MLFTMFLLYDILVSISVVVDKFIFGQARSRRVATAQGKQGIWFLLFPDRENTGNLVLTFSRQGKHREFGSGTGKNLLTQGKYLDCDY